MSINKKIWLLKQQLSPWWEALNKVIPLQRCLYVLIVYIILLVVVLVMYVILLERRETSQQNFSQLTRTLASYNEQRKLPSFVLYEKIVGHEQAKENNIGNYKSSIEQIFIANGVQVVSSEENGDTINYIVVTEPIAFLKIYSELEATHLGLFIKLNKIYREKSQTYISFSVGIIN